MNGLGVMVVMLGGFALAVYGAHAFVQRLRRRGYGERIDALHDATVRAQGRFLRTVAVLVRPSGSRGYPPSRAAPPPDDPFNTKQD